MATFSRMSPFKVRQSNNQLSTLCSTSSTSSNNSSRKLFGSTTVKSSLMQRFANFASLDASSPTTSRVVNNEKVDLALKKSSQIKTEFEEKKQDYFTSSEAKSFHLLKNLSNSTNASLSILYPSTSSIQDDGSNSNDHHFESEIRDFAVASNDDAESEIDDVVASSTSSDNTGIKTSRKEKSLGKLCRRFLLTMGEEAKTSTNDVHLESVARKMSKFNLIKF